MVTACDECPKLLKVGAYYKRNGKAPAVKHLIKWQPCSGKAKRKAEDNLQDSGLVTLCVRHEQTNIDIPYRSCRQSALSKLFTAYKSKATTRNFLLPADLPSVQFMFDGHILSGTETAEDLDLDDNDIIKVTW